jgi:hypothetical protein
VALEGRDIPDPITLVLSVGDLGETRVETLMAAYEDGFKALKESLRNVEGVSAVKIYRSYSGIISGNDIFESPE